MKLRLVSTNTGPTKARRSRPRARARVLAQTVTLAETTAAKALVSRAAIAVADAHSVLQHKAVASDPELRQLAQAAAVAAEEVFLRADALEQRLQLLVNPAPAKHAHRAARGLLDEATREQVDRYRDDALAADFDDEFDPEPSHGVLTRRWEMWFARINSVTRAMRTPLAAGSAEVLARASITDDELATLADLSDMTERAGQAIVSRGRTSGAIRERSVL